jgi:hypothetical protein
LRERVRSRSVRGVSVQEDWHAWLTEAKEIVFHSYSKQLESNYAMFSISLNEAIGLRREGHLGTALEAVGLSPGLCRLLTQPLSGLLCGLSEHARHYGTMPNVAPLDPLNFRGSRSQRSARIHALLHRVLLSHHYQFLYKINTLEEIVDDLSNDFCLAASGLAEYTCADPLATWASLDTDHYDLNTCLREGLILLKSFLLAVPEDQLHPFRQTTCEQSQTTGGGLSVRQHSVPHRRTAPFAGE